MPSVYTQEDPLPSLSYACGLLHMLKYFTLRIPSWCYGIYFGPPNGIIFVSPVHRQPHTERVILETGFSSGEASTSPAAS